MKWFGLREYRPAASTLDDEVPVPWVRSALEIAGNRSEKEIRGSSFLSQGGPRILGPKRRTTDLAYIVSFSGVLPKVRDLRSPRS